jgi:hypothetical protein
MEILPFLLMPFLASLILAGIHGVLGGAPGRAHAFRSEEEREILFLCWNPAYFIGQGEQLLRESL